MMNSGPARYRRGVSGDAPQISPSFGPYTGFLTPPSPYSGIDERRGSIVSLSASEYSVPTPTSERSPFSEASWQHVTPLGGFQQTQPMSGLRHPLSLGNVGVPMKPATTEPFCNDWTMSSGNDMPLRMQDTMPTGNAYLPSQMGTYTESPLSPSSHGSNWSFSTAPEHTELDYAMSSQQTFWQPQVPSTHAMAGQTIAPSDALVGEEDYSFVEDDSSSFVMETDAFDNAPMPFPTSPHDSAPMALPPSPQEVEVKQELEGSEADDKFTHSIHVSPQGGKTVKKERRQPGVAKRRNSKSKSQLVVRRNHNGHIDVEGYQLNPLTGKREPIGGPTVEWKYCDWVGCTSRFKRPEHLKRHQRIHLGVKEHECRVEGCPKVFDRRDNYWQHGTTHIRVPGKKDGRNSRLPFRQMIKYADDAKHIEFLEKAYKKLCPEDHESEDESFGNHSQQGRIRCRL